MDYELIAPAFEDTAVDKISHQDGVIDILPKLSMSIPDEEMIKGLNNRIEDSVNYWDDIQGYNLKYARAQSERMLLGKQIDISKLYRYQIPYIDNEIHVSIDTIISYITAQTPRPEVYPAQSTEQSKIIARDLEKAMQAYADKQNIGEVFEQALQALLVKRLGAIKLWYDPDLEEICTRTINPDWLIIDKNALQGDNPAFICEIHKDTLEDLILQFPKKKEQIFNMAGVKRGTQRQLTQEVVWREVHATVYDGGKQQEVVFCFCKNVMLAKYKDPNWLYDQDGGRLQNFLDAPIKPYIPLNYLNDGTHWVDQTTPIEQAYSMQDVLNKRGRQIMENADTANGFLAVSSEAINMDEAENLVGDPNQKIVLDTKGRPIGEFIQQVPPHMLPNFVVADKGDLRATLHSLMGTPAELSGTNQDPDKDQTLGEAIMIKNQASGRQDRLARSVERAATQYYNFLAQMMRVHYTKKHWFVYNGGDGDFDHIVLTRHMIDKGMQINVRSGTTLPFDKARQESIAMNLAKMGLISPIDLYKDLHMDNPQQRYDNWYKFKSDPQGLARDLDNKQQDGQAYIEFVEIMNNAKDVKPFDEATQEHILTHRKQMITDEFLNAPRKQQNALLELVQKELQSLVLRQQLDELSQPVGQKPETPTGAPRTAPSSPPMGLPTSGAPVGAPAPIPSIGGIMQASGGVPQVNVPPVMNMANPMQLPTI